MTSDLASTGSLLVWPLAGVACPSGTLSPFGGPAPAGSEQQIACQGVNDVLKNGKHNHE